MKITGGANLDFLLTNFDFDRSQADVLSGKKTAKQGFVLEGGSGSGKTYDIIHFLILYCQHYSGKNKDILVFRETFADLTKTVYKDFEKVLRMYGLYREADHFKSHPTHYNLYGNKIYFSGLDKMGSHGERHDLIWGNEAMEIDKDGFRQLNQRCSEAFILDYNPSTTDHWIFDEIIPRKDTKFFHSTQLDNAFLPEGQRQEILNYQPISASEVVLKGKLPFTTDVERAKARDYDFQNNPLGFDIYELQELHRCVENEEQGTADDYHWNVYGLGLRSSPEGIVFQHVTWIDRFPENIEKLYYGLDFGYTIDPTALIRMGVDGQNLYLEKLHYSPTESSNILIPILNEKIPVGSTIWADSSDPGMISDCRQKGLNVFAVKKFNGAINYGISLLKKYKIHIVDCPEWLKEQSNYKWREVNGIRLDEPVDEWNHLWDAARYAAISNLRMPN